METSAGYYDGRSSARREITLALTGDELHLTLPEGETVTCTVSEVRVSEGVGTIRRSIMFPDGGMCEVADASFLAAIEQRQGKRRGTGLLHRWERSLPLVAAALFLTAAVVVVFMRFGVPALARYVARIMPLSTEQTLGRETLATLDHLFFKESALGEERRRELTALFKRVTASSPGGESYRLEFRSGKRVGANALALPSGIVVVTDELVQLARNDQEIAGVLAHEVGHVRGRHLLRHVLQNSVAGLIMASLTGDILSVTSLSATLPTALVRAKFSREFELEADDAAVAYLKREGISLRSYGELLARLQVEMSIKSAGTAADDTGLRSYLSTHPETGDRIRRVLANEEPGERK